MCWQYALTPSRVKFLSNRFLVIAILVDAFVWHLLFLKLNQSRHCWQSQSRDHHCAVHTLLFTSLRCFVHMYSEFLCSMAHVCQCAWPIKLITMYTWQCWLKPPKGRCLIRLPQQWMLVLWHVSTAGCWCPSPGISTHTSLHYRSENEIKQHKYCTGNSADTLLPDCDSLFASLLALQCDAKWCILNVFKWFPLDT